MYIYVCQINAVCFKGNEKSLCPLTHIFHSQSAHLISSGKQDCHIWETEISLDCFLPLHACCVRVLLQNTQQETQNSVLSMFSAWFMSWCDKKIQIMSFCHVVQPPTSGCRWNICTIPLFDWNSLYVWDCRNFQVLFCLSLFVLPLSCPSPFYTPSYFLGYMEGNSQLHNTSCRAVFASSQERKKRRFYLSVYL